MKQPLLSCCKCPTTVLFLDDDPTFLSHLSLKMNDAHRVETYTVVKEAISEVNNRPTLSSSCEACINDLSHDDEQDYTADVMKVVDFSKLRNLHGKNNKDKFISVIVVDYSMPEMNGIEFCRKLNNTDASGCI